MTIYYWDECEFNEGFRGYGHAISYAPDLETAIQAILAECREDYGRWEDSKAACKKVGEIEAELRSTEPIINPLVILIWGND